MGTSYHLVVRPNNLVKQKCSWFSANIMNIYICDYI